MDYCIGIDGGGTRTRYVAVDASGRVCGERRGGGGSYRDRGAEAVGEMLAREVRELIRDAGIRDADVPGIFFGMPCYGESGEKELADATGTVSRLLAPWRVAYGNDVIASWAGAFALPPEGGGVAVLSGTGAMSITRDASGRVARCGGWSEFFSDEGSCYWLGVETMRLFSRQADGRAEKGALYNIVRDFFHLADDYEIIDIMHEEYFGKRDRVAELQLLLRDAAQAGDPSCTALYAAAARELAGLARGLAAKTKTPDGEDTQDAPVSYAGGLFRAGELILAPFAEAIRQFPGLHLSPPLLDPLRGAALLAVEAFRPDLLPRVRAGLLNGKDDA